MKKSLLKTVSALSLLIALVLTGCGGDSTPGNLSAYQQGSNKCSDQFVSDYIQLYITFASVSSSSDLDNAQSSLNNFSSQYKDVVCKLEVEGQSEMVNVNDLTSRLNSGISQARAQISSGSTSTLNMPPSSSQTSSRPAPTVHARAADAFKNGITLQVHDKATFNPAHERGIGSMIIQNGNLVSSFEVDRSSDYCTIMYLQQDTEVEAESSLRLQLADANSLRVEFYPTNFSFTLTCQKAEGSSNDISIEDLNRILGRLATASISQ